MADALIVAIAYLMMSYFDKQRCCSQNKMGVVEKNVFLSVLQTDQTFQKQGFAFQTVHFSHNCILKSSKRQNDNRKQPQKYNPQIAVQVWTGIHCQSTHEFNSKFARVRSYKTFLWIICLWPQRNKLYIWHACWPKSSIPDWRHTGNCQNKGNT